jgi:thiol:disulfide interchange protein DsbD
MIPITISIFSKGKKLSRGESLVRAGVYAAGIIISFTVMGGVIQAAFGSAGQGIVKTIALNGPLNLGIAALFIYFALSFFGYYEVELPEFLRAFVEKSVGRAKSSVPGEAGVPLPALFLMGFFFVLTSYTCGAPLVLGVLTAGLATPGKGSVLLATGVFGATTAAPFFTLALVPGLLKSLPRSGSWFKTFKVVLGTIELAAALKFLSNADLYWRTSVLTRNVFLALWVAAGVFMTLYVAHVLKLSHDEEAIEPEPKFQPKAWLRAVPFVLATCYVGDALNGARLPSDGTGLAHLRFEVGAAFEGFLPPDPYPGTEKKIAAAEPGRLPQYANYAKALAAARASKKKLFLEFTGHA